MSVAYVWTVSAFCRRINNVCFYDSNGTDEILDNILCGKKSANTGLLSLFEAQMQLLPRTGDYTVVLDSDMQPRCITRTTKVEVVPFEDVTADCAAAEGNGTLAVWKKAHRKRLPQRVRKSAWVLTKTRSASANILMWFTGQMDSESGFVEEKLMEELIQRCSWATTDLYKEYHDNEWGKPVHDENKLFEMLILEGMQAGLSWLTILNKREAFRIAFDNFDCKKVALYDDAKIEELMQNSSIVRNRLKIKSAITNAQQFIKIQESYGSFDSFIWSYVDGKPILNHFQTETDIPARTALSDQISKDLKKLGFKFVGSTIIYAYMQAIGIVNDHVKGCHLYANK